MLLDDIAYIPQGGSGAYDVQGHVQAFLGDLDQALGVGGNVSHLDHNAAVAVVLIIDHGDIIKNTDMKSLLATLDVETFILDLRESITHCPHVEGMEIVVRDNRTLEASLPKRKSLNNLFAELEKQGIHVLSMRNKANRLEELFMRLVEKGHQRAGEAA